MRTEYLLSVPVYNDHTSAINVGCGPLIDPWVMGSTDMEIPVHILVAPPLISMMFLVASSAHTNAYLLKISLSYCTTLSTKTDWVGTKNSSTHSYSCSL